MTSQHPIQGSRSKLVLAFDIGMTHSGISYSIVDPGSTPKISAVTRFSGVDGIAKVPSIIWYDQQGNVAAIGAEALSESTMKVAKGRGWFKAEWFKLHFCPEASRPPELKSWPLPPNKTAAGVYADFLSYLFEAAASFIRSIPEGEQIWESYKVFVLSHPNDWASFQQSQMKRAAVLAGLVSDAAEGSSRITLVTEGEANLHFAISNGLPQGVPESGEGVIMIDAGGATIDLSAYVQHSNGGRFFKEIAQPQTHFHGSVFVSFNFRKFLQAGLGDSRSIEELDHIMRCFDKTTKHGFKDAGAIQHVKFKRQYDNETTIRLAGSDVESFFKPSVECIVYAVLKQRYEAREPIKYVIMVGGFASNDWLYSKVWDSLTAHDLAVFLPEGDVAKAVSNGAILYYIHNSSPTTFSDSHLVPANIGLHGGLAESEELPPYDPGLANDFNDKSSRFEAELQSFADSPAAKNALHEAIHELKKSALGVDNDFKKVAQRLSGAAKAAPTHRKAINPLIQEWDVLHKSYKELVWESRRVAGQARATLTDFAGVFLDSLTDDSISVFEKRREIEAYQEILKADSDKPQKLSDGFKDLSRKLETFLRKTEKWIKGASNVNSDLEDIAWLKVDIERTQRDIEELTSQMLTLGGATLTFFGATACCGALGALCPLLWIASAAAVAMAIGTGIAWKQMEKKKNAYQIQLSERRRDLDEKKAGLDHMQAAKNALNDLHREVEPICQKLLIFSHVWAIISSDLTEIEKAMDLARGSAGERLFKKRMITVSRLYHLLASALREYEISVSDEVIFREKE